MNFKKMFVSFVVFVAVLVILVLLTPACKKNDNIQMENHADIISMNVWYESEEEGARLFVKDIMLRYSNDNYTYSDGLMKIDWVSGQCGHGRYEEAVISLPSTGGEERVEALDPYGVERDAWFEFKGEKTETIKFDIEFMGYRSMYEKTVTMKSL